jgi:hypothetical protein
VLAWWGRRMGGCVASAVLVVVSWTNGVVLWWVCPGDTLSGSLLDVMHACMPSHEGQNGPVPQSGQMMSSSHRMIMLHRAQRPLGMRLLRLGGKGRVLLGMVPTGVRWVWFGLWGGGTSVCLGLCCVRMGERKLGHGVGGVVVPNGVPGELGLTRPSAPILPLSGGSRTLGRRWVGELLSDRA